MVGLQREITVRRLHQHWEMFKHDPKYFVSEEQFTRLAKHFPEYVKRDGLFRCREYIDKKVLSEALEFVKEMGLTVQEHKGNFPAQVKIVDYWEGFTSAEIAQAKCFEFQVNCQELALGECCDVSDHSVVKVADKSELTQNLDKHWGGLGECPIYLL